MDPRRAEKRTEGITEKEERRGKKGRDVMRFEDLDAWMAARSLTVHIYQLMREPEMSRDFGLRDQIQRAAVSTMSNIAEGFERKGIQEKLYFYGIARASNGEVRSLTYVIEDNYPQFLPMVHLIRPIVLQVGSLVTGLIRSTEKRRA